MATSAVLRAVGWTWFRGTPPAPLPEEGTSDTPAGGAGRQAAAGDTLSSDADADRPAAGGGDGDGRDKDEGGDRGGGGGGDGGRGGDDEGDPTPVRWVTIATFSLPTEAHLARLRLEAADITCLLLDEHMVSVNWLLSPAVGGIKLQVPEDQAEAARHALGGDVIEWDEAEAEAMAVCPYCREGEFAMAPVPKWVLAVSILLLGIPLLFLPRVWRCTACRRPMPHVEPRGTAGRDH